MGELIRGRLPCPNPDCGSSDAFHEYTDGTYCFSCGQGTKKGKMDNLEYKKDEGEFTYNFHPHRGLTVETCKFYGILTKFDRENNPQKVFFPYTPDGKNGKVRAFENKRSGPIQAVGDMKSATLFGKHLFPPGSSDQITITVGEYDAPSLYQVTGRPAVSVRGAATARKDCKEERDYLNSFKKIILAFDNDAADKAAAQAVASLFDFNKVYTVEFDKELKDANGYLQTNRGEELKRAWWNHRRYMPEGVLSSFSDFDAVFEDVTYSDPVGEFPFSALQDATYGIRPGEITLFTAPEGIGKTEIIRAIEHHLLKTTDINIGIVHLEENKARTIKGLAGLHLRSPVHLPDSQVSLDDVKSAFRDLVKRDDRLHVYSHFGSDDPNVILDTIRFMAGPCECRVIFLDHITMLATGLAEVDERRTLDYLSTKLGSMVNELKFHLILISHVNDDGLTRGSRNISKIANTRVDMFRDIKAADETTRNTTALTISKNRFASITGPVGSLFFDKETFTLNEHATEDAHGELPS